MSGLKANSVDYDNITTAERDALVLPGTGTIIFNSDVNNHEYNKGTPAAPVWVSLSGGEYGKASQNSANWSGNGQILRTPLSWCYFDNTLNDDLNFHDPTAAESGTATGVHSATTLQDTSKVWAVDQWKGYLIRITGGVDNNDVVRVVSNTVDTLTVDASWITTVDNTSTYEISLAGRLTAPVTGTYDVGVLINFGASAAGIRGVQLWKISPAGVLSFIDTVFTNPVGTVESAVIWPANPYKIDKDDSIIIKAYQTSGGNLVANGFRFRFFMKLLK